MFFWDKDRLKTCCDKALNPLTLESGFFDCNVTVSFVGLG